MTGRAEIWETVDRFLAAPVPTRCQECDRRAPLRQFEGLLLCDRCIGDRLAEQGRED